jgi:DNA-binding phage protein
MQCLASTELAESVEARVSLYRALSEQGNRTLSIFNSIIYFQLHYRGSQPGGELY